MGCDNIQRIENGECANIEPTAFDEEVWGNFMNVHRVKNFFKAGQKKIS